jgi:folate-binding protein YgfZ
VSDDAQGRGAARALGGRSALELAAAARRTAALFALPARGILEVAGEDRVRWLDGMLTNDVRRLEPGPERSGCRALALTRKGGIVADVRVWLRPEAFWLETDAAAIPGLALHLRGLVVADDVRLAEAGRALELLGLEGPASREVLERAAGRAVELAEGAVAELEIAGVAAAVAAYGESGEAAFRLALPAEGARRARDSLLAAGAASGLVAGSDEALEILRVEAGTPRFGAELAPDVLPAEARLEAAIAFDKGCYTGQEIVARVESRGQVKRHLVGLRVEGELAPTRGTSIEAAGAGVGEITSGCISPAHGAIGLGFARIPHDAPGTPLRVGGRPARVASLPFAESRGRR